MWHPRSSTTGTWRLARKKCRSNAATWGTKEPPMTGPTQIQEKALRPSGLLPKKIQSWLLIGLALLMVVIMWVTGGKKPQAPIKTMPSTNASQAPIEVNEAKIAELQNRIQDLQREQ